MGLWAQLGFGALIMAICSALHLALILASATWLDRVNRNQKQRHRHHRASLLICIAFLVVLVGHSAQIWIWAFSYLWFDALDGLEPAMYFALSNYTTLGYGDLLLGEDLRVFAAFASVNGMLIFGASTAYLVGVVSKILPQELR